MGNDTGLHSSRRACGAHHEEVGHRRQSTRKAVDASQHQPKGCHSFRKPLAGAGATGRGNLPDGRFKPRMSGPHAKDCPSDLRRPFLARGLPITPGRIAEPARTALWTSRLTFPRPFGRRKEKRAANWSNGPIANADPIGSLELDNCTRCCFGVRVVLGSFRFFNLGYGELTIDLVSVELDLVAGFD